MGLSIVSLFVFITVENRQAKPMVLQLEKFEFAFWLFASQLS